MLRFPHCFWGDADMFGHVSTSPQQRGLFYLFYTYDCISGGSVLAGLVAGQAAEEFEGLKEGQAVQQVMALLKGIFGPQGISVPDPIRVGGCGFTVCVMVVVRGEGDELE
jgi:lysine-specific histone demethylase 1